MAILEILKFPHKALLTECKPVTIFDDHLRTLLDDMWETMKAAGGVGLAANQVGLPHRMFVMEDAYGDKLNIVNPNVERVSTFPANVKEGCLSAPDESLVLRERTDWVILTYKDESGEPRRVLLKDLQSVIALHELDHINGVSFLQYDSIPRAKRKALAKKWRLP